MADEFEYVEVECIMVPTEDGSEMECAIMNQFSYEGQEYIVLAPVNGEAIEDEVILFRYSEKGDDMIFEAIDDDLRAKIADYYNQLLDEIEDDEEE